MGAKQGKIPSPMNKKDLLECYIRSEFGAMDTDNDNKLSRQEVLDLLVLLGCSNGRQKLQNFPGNSHVNLEDYVTEFKSDKVLIDQTCQYRKLFQEFDTNGNGTAIKDEIIAGLKSLEINADKKLHDMVEKMDANKDGLVTYKEFLAMVFQKALNK